ncbi:MAG: amidohydrolase family protein [Alphaproteobacteria bacterium]|nr:amidohydrolase family protein [Alphaproteobacteria bacterium]
MNAEQIILRGVALAGRLGRHDIVLSGERIAAITASDAHGGGFIMPAMTDAHVHLDKTFTTHRLGRRAGSLLDAIELAAGDSMQWNADDIRCRATNALERAYRHGTVRMRTHVDWLAPTVPLAWPVLHALRAAWRGRIDLQLVALAPLDLLFEAGEPIARRVRRDGGVLGAFIYRDPDLQVKVSRLFDLAERHDLALDLHVDECLEPNADGIDIAVRETAARGYGGRVLCGHCCALSIRPDDETHALLERAAEAGVALCVLPATNAWLQDNAPGRTPRLRGLAPLHEARAAGMEVMLASDNCRDAFYPWGDYDLWDIFRLAAVSAHLDPASWLDAVTDTPAALFGALPGLVEGAVADFILFDAEDADDAVSRARCSRQVWRHGAVIRQGLVEGAAQVGAAWQ